MISWFDDMADRELVNLIPFFEALADVDDVYTFLGTATGDFFSNHANTIVARPPTPTADGDVAGIDIEVSAATTEDSVQAE